MHPCASLCILVKLLTVIVTMILIPKPRLGFPILVHLWEAIDCHNHNNNNTETHISMLIINALTPDSQQNGLANTCVEDVEDWVEEDQQRCE